MPDAVVVGFVMPHGIRHVRGILKMAFPDTIKEQKKVPHVLHLSNSFFMQIFLHYCVGYKLLLMKVLWPNKRVMHQLKFTSYMILGDH